MLDVTIIIHVPVQVLMNIRILSALSEDVHVPHYTFFMPQKKHTAGISNHIYRPTSPNRISIHGTHQVTQIALKHALIRIHVSMVYMFVMEIFHNVPLLLTEIMLLITLL